MGIRVTATPNLDTLMDIQLIQTWPGPHNHNHLVEGTKIVTADWGIARGRSALHDDFIANARAQGVYS